MKTNIAFTAVLTATLLLGGFGLFDLSSARDILSLQNFMAGELSEMDVDYEEVELDTGDITPLLESSLESLEPDGPVGGVEPGPVIIERESVLTPETEAEIIAESTSETVELPPVEVVPGLEVEVDPDLPKGGAAPEEDQEELQGNYFDDKRGDYDTQQDAYQI